MAPWIEKIPGLGQKLLNSIKAIGPLIISQSDKASEAFQRHLGRVAEAEAFRDLLKSEVETRAAVRRTLLDNYMRASDAERVRIERDLEFIDGKVRLINVVSKSLLYAPRQESSRTKGETPKQIEGHWLDYFNALSRQRNEEWRGELLSRAFAQEAEVPGSVSPRVLWLIGNMEQPMFEALSSLLDLCVWTVPDGAPFLPRAKDDIFRIKPHNAAPESHVTVGELVFRLGDVGVLADHLTSSLNYSVGGRCVVRHDKKVYVIAPKKELTIQGILFTPLGNSIAKFHEPQWNATALKILEDWKASISPADADISEANLE